MKPKSKDRSIHNFKALLGKTLTKFFTNIAKIQECLPYVMTLNQNFRNQDIVDTARMLVSEFEPVSDDLFSDNCDSVFKLTIFKGTFPLEHIASQQASIKYLRLIYTYAVGCVDYAKGESLVVSQKEKEAVSKETDFPPNITKLMDFVVPGIRKKINGRSLESVMKGFDASNPIASLLGSGIDVNSMMSDIVPLLSQKIDSMDKDELAKEIAQVLKAVSASKN